MTLALVVFLSAIAVFFSDELQALYKKMVAIPGVKLFVPLVFASWFVENYQTECYRFLVKFHFVTSNWVKKIVALSPIQTGALLVVHIIYLFLLTLLPIGLCWLYSQYKKRKDDDDDTPWAAAYRLCAGLWLVAGVLLATQPGLALK